MKIRTEKVLNILVVIMAMILFCAAFPAMALEIPTHRSINEYISQNNLNGFFLDDYVKKQLGMQDGIKTRFNDFPIIRWLAEGGEEEDNTPRYFRHFLNPMNNQGLIWNSTTYPSSLDWALMSLGSQGFTGNFSWNDARDYYLKALTSTDKITRETNFTKTFQAVGQVMHLVQDMSVPAHTRNNSHGSGDGYELWAKQFVKDTTQVSTYSVISFTPNDSSFLILKLFDTDQYNGSNPTLSNNIGLSEYTNANFLSQGTIFTTNFSYPAYADMSPKVETNPTTKKQILYLSKKGHGESVDYFARALSLHNYLPADYKKLALTLDDDQVHANYAHFLIPRAIGYSSQVLSYFFRGELDVEMSNGSLKVRNASQETMTGGKFDLYYDKATGERNLLTSDDVSAFAPGADQTINFSPPQDVSSYMLVYRDGTLGNETNAVIGKFIPVEEFVVITVSLNGISGENLIKKSVLVWNPESNKLEQGPVDKADAAFQSWYTTKILSSVNMFSLAEADNNPPYKIEPGLVDTPLIKYHDYNTVPHTIFPQSNYQKVLLPDSPTDYIGIRIKRDDTDKSTVRYSCYLVNNMDIVDMPLDFQGEEPEYLGMSVHDYITLKRKWTAYGLFGELFSIISPSITETGVDHLGPPSINPQWGREMSKKTLTNYIAPWVFSTTRASGWSDTYWQIKQKEWTDNIIVGQYSDKTIATLCLFQYATVEEIMKDYWGIHTDVWNQTSDRVVVVQAQAFYVPQGTTGYDWVVKGRNTELETQIIAAINMAYTLNRIPTSEIRKTSLSIEIVK